MATNKSPDHPIDETHPTESVVAVNRGPEPTIHTGRNPPQPSKERAQEVAELAMEIPVTGEANMTPTQKRILEAQIEDYKSHYEAEKEAHAATTERLSQRNAELENTQKRLGAAVDKCDALEKKLDKIQAGLESATKVLADLRVQHRGEIARKETLMSVVCAFASKGKRS